MTDLVTRLRRFPFFASLQDETCAAIAAKGIIRFIPGGARLYSHGSPPERLFFILSGRVIIARYGEEGDRVIGYAAAGDPVGEMSVMLGHPRSADTFALRDCEVLILSRADAEQLRAGHADFAAALGDCALRRARKPAVGNDEAAPNVFALISTSPSIAIEAHGKTLADALTALGVKTRVLTGLSVDIGTVEEPGTSEEETANPRSESDIIFGKIEQEHDAVLLVTRVEDSPWYRFVLRHADRFFVFARRDARPPIPFPLMPNARSPARRFRLVDLVLLQEGQPACPIRDWHTALNAERIFKWGNRASIDRIARTIAGKSIGLCLSGGGARAYAHIGIVRAMRELGIPIDFIGGTSMGALIAACVAMDWDDREIHDRIHEAFVASNPLGDFNLPVVALSRGRRVEDRLLLNFSNQLIEDMALPFFCVSTDLTAGEDRVHHFGLLRAALRASIALPGILPPVVDGDRVLVDGGVINNLPMDVLATRHRGLNIAADVARRGTINADLFRDPKGFFAWIGKNGFSAPPPVVGLLTRASSVRREGSPLTQTPDILLSPALETVDLRSWKDFDAACDEGYRLALETLTDHYKLVALGLGSAAGHQPA